MTALTADKSSNSFSGTNTIISAQKVVFDTLVIWIDYHNFAISQTKRMTTFLMYPVHFLSTENNKSSAVHIHLASLWTLFTFPGFSEAEVIIFW